MKIYGMEDGDGVPVPGAFSCDDSATIPGWEGRAILLVDLDAFFASVEQLDHPEWRGHPVIVGGSAEKRGVVSTASYEAREFGVHSGMPSWQAKQLCPNAIWTHGNYPRYTEVSSIVMGIIWDETPLVQQVSIDEAFADVTPGKHVGEHPVRIAQRIRARVSELGVTCSVGVGTTKTIAKIASDMDKPNGLTVIYPGHEREFLDPLPVGKISGIGPKSKEKLHVYGIETIRDLAASDERLLSSIFGINGKTMLMRARGEEDSAIEVTQPVKSVSNEQSFAKDLTQRDEIIAAIDMIAAKVGRRLRRKGLAGYTVSLVVRYHDLSFRSAQRTLSYKVDDEHQMTPILHELIEELWKPGIALRLVGVAVEDFSDKPVQLSLFGDDEARTQPNTAPGAEGGGLAKATDAVKNRFGETAVRYGRELRFEGRDTGTMAQHKDLADLQKSARPSFREGEGDDLTYVPADDE